MSSAAVVAASRNWVCIRTTTYEDEAEYLYLNKAYNQDSLWGPDRRGGQLPNTFCALLAPDGVTRLTQIGRHPEFLLSTIRELGHPAGTSGSTSQRFADLMNFLFEEHGVRGRISTPPVSALPVALDFRRALNVAACDNRPLVVALAQRAERLQEFEGQLAKIAWETEFVGRLNYALVSDREELRVVSGVDGSEGFFVVQSGQFGLKGEVLAAANRVGGRSEELRGVLRDGLQRFRRSGLERAEHVRSGLAAGAAWETAVPKNTVVHKDGPPAARQASERR